MNTGEPTLSRTRPQRATPLPARGDHPALGPDDYAEGFGEKLTDTLDLGKWRLGSNLAEEYDRIHAEIAFALRQESAVQRQLREVVFPRLAWGENAPKMAGHHTVSVEEIARIHQGLLFPGGVEACDGTSETHDRLALTIHQLGVGLVSYGGDQGTWCQRLYRHDMRLANSDLVNETLELLERRGRRSALNHEGRHDRLSQLARRAIMTYVERAVLLHEAQAPWRMGQGSPAPYELLMGGGYPDLTIESIKVIRGLVEHQKFVFVTSEPVARDLLTIGQALHPLEFAVVCRLSDLIAPFLEKWETHLPVTVDSTWDGKPLRPEGWVRRLRDEVAPQVVVGVYRATLLAPPQMFYAHDDHADLAARIALADSVLLEQRGFPMLLDLADKTCKAVYGGGSLREVADDAYAAASAPYRYGSERDTRDS